MTDTLRIQQFALARHLRDPARHAPPPGVEPRRLLVYREVFFGAIESLCLSVYTRWRSKMHRKCAVASSSRRRRVTCRPR